MNKKCRPCAANATSIQRAVSGSEELDSQALARAEPQLRPGLAGALLVPEDAVIYAPCAARWLRRDSSLQLGATVSEIGRAASVYRMARTSPPVRPSALCCAPMKWTTAQLGVYNLLQSGRWRKYAYTLIYF